MRLSGSAAGAINTRAVVRICCAILKSAGCIINVFPEVDLTEDLALLWQNFNGVGSFLIPMRGFA